MPDSFDAKWRPCLAPGVTVCPADRGRWQIRRDFDSISFLEGEACDECLARLIPLLDGTHSVEELQTILGMGNSPEKLGQVLDCLRSENALSQGDPAAPGASALWAALDSMGIRAGDTIARLASTKILVCAHSDFGRRLTHSLVEQGFRLTVHCATAHAFGVERERFSEGVALVPIVVERDWDHAHIESINLWALESKVTWGLAAAWNSRVLVGPLFVPGQTGCYHCYRKRLDSHRHELGAYRAFEAARSSGGEPTRADASLPCIEELASAVISQQLFAHFGMGGSSRIVGRALFIQPATWKVTEETLLRLPWCGVCGVDGPVANSI